MLNYHKLQGRTVDVVDRDSSIINEQTVRMDTESNIQPQLPRLAERQRHRNNVEAKISKSLLLSSNGNTDVRHVHIRNKLPF